MKSSQWIIIKLNILGKQNFFQHKIQNRKVQLTQLKVLEDAIYFTFFSKGVNQIEDTSNVDLSRRIWQFNSINVSVPLIECHQGRVETQQIILPSKSYELYLGVIPLRIFLK